VLAKSVNAIQRYLVTETRLKIPAIFHNEAMSGVVAPHFTAFPTSIGLAAMWDPPATEAMACGPGPCSGAHKSHLTANPIPCGSVSSTAGEVR
jgi:hypothetical protein